MISLRDFVFTAWEVGKEKHLEGCHISNSFTLTHNYPAEAVTSNFSDSWKRRMLLHVRSWEIQAQQLALREFSVCLSKFLNWPLFSPYLQEDHLISFTKDHWSSSFLVFLGPWVDTKHLQSIRHTMFRCSLDLHALPST